MEFYPEFHDFTLNLISLTKSFALSLLRVYIDQSTIQSNTQTERKE